MKRVLWLVSWYPNRLQPFAGDFIQRHAQAVSIHQPIHVIFVVKDAKGNFTSDLKIEHHSSDTLSEVIAYYKSATTGIPILDRVLSIIKYIKVSWRLISSFMEENGPPKIVHVHVALWAGVLAVYMKKKSAIRYFVTEHWTGYQRNSLNSIYKRGFIFRNLTKRVLKNADLLLPVSKHLGELINKNFYHIDYNVIHNVVNTKYFNYEKYDLPVFRFIHVSSMNYQKNVEGILNVLSSLLECDTSWLFTAVGPSTSDLRDQCTRLGLDKNVQWKGELTYEQVAIEMKRSSAMVLFSRYENLPCVVLEALCCGLPVIATAVGGIPEIINEENGILIQAENESELLTAMMDIMMKRHIDFNRMKIAEDSFTKFNYEEVGKQVQVCYNRYS